MEERGGSGMKKQNILLINICKEKLHYYEFVKPVCDILDKEKIKYFVKKYHNISKKDLKKSSKVIICGTSLFDNEFIKDISRLSWVLNFHKPILGICGGMQIIGIIFGGKLNRKTEIGFYKEIFKKEFLNLCGEKEIYHLHNNYIDFSKIKNFEIYCGNGISQAVIHREKEIYGVLFHPEVRNKEMIVNFCKIE